MSQKKNGSRDSTGQKIKSSSIAKLNNNNNNNKRNNGNFDSSYSPKQILKLLDNINIKIISELVSNPNMSSLSLATKLDIPLSTLQRRRARIENAILKKTYTLNFKAFGARIGDLIVDVDKGKSKEIAHNLLKKYKNNIISCDTRINSQHNVSAHVIYKGTDELHELIESVRTMDYVTGVDWSEMVGVAGDNNSEVVQAFFANNH
jgi:DNA-binding Lrp family transcriptional regulator